jgi:hypothetical protein
LKFETVPETLKNTLRAALMLVCALIFLPSMPVNYFTVTGNGRLLFSSPAPNGYSFVTTYIHSLERTPVRDDYRFTGGRIWGWEEWTMSLNAGLPSVLSPRSRLVLSPPWMITRGGGAHGAIHYRIGNAGFGRNTWRLDPWDEINVFEKYPGLRVSLEASVAPLGEAEISGFGAR